MDEQVDNVSLDCAIICGSHLTVSVPLFQNRNLRPQGTCSSQKDSILYGLESVSCSIEFMMREFK